MNWRRWINKDNETLFDLIFGCIVYSIVFEAIGLLVVENKVSYSLGLLLGIGMRSGYFSFPGIIIGILGLKISAYFHAYTNVYITKKLYKKGR